MKFDRTSILGSGGYGVVFRGEWNNKIVAVKRIEKKQIVKTTKEKMRCTN
jgi:serine/threonine protein kinase